jgi:hypothetical protein
MINRIQNLSREIFKVLCEPPSIVALFYAITVFIGGQFFDMYKESQHRREAIISGRVSAFVDSTREFDSLIAALAHGVMDKDGPDVPDRDKIFSNLAQQYSELDDLQQLVKNNPKILDEYRNSLLKLNDTLPSVNSILEMKAYWESVAHVLEARKELNARLREASNQNLN